MEQSNIKKRFSMTKFLCVVASALCALLSIVCFVVSSLPGLALSLAFLHVCFLLLACVLFALNLLCNQLTKKERVLYSLAVGGQWLALGAVCISFLYALAGSLSGF